MNGSDVYKGFLIGSKVLPSVSEDSERIFVGLHGPDGGPESARCGEFAIRWEAAGPVLQVFSDAFHVLAQLPEVPKMLAELEKKNSLNPKAVIAALKKLGFREIKADH